MKVQLIVVQGKPEGKTIPLVGPVFRIGRGDTCHLRPSSEQVSREHAEFAVSADKVTIRDLGSRNGTLVNGKAITEQWVLKDRDLVQVGNLTFAVSIQGVTAPAAKAAPAPAAARPASQDENRTDDIDSWLVADSKNAVPDRPSGVYGGDTITVAAFKDDKRGKTPTPPPPPAPVPLDEDDEPVSEEDETQDEVEAINDEDEETPAGGEVPEDFIDESNPCHVKKAKPEAAAPKPGTGKQTFKDTSDAASEILRKMMERRKQK